MKLIIYTIMIAFCVGVVHAKEKVKIFDIKIVEQGIYNSEIRNVANSDPNFPDGKYVTTPKATLLKETDQVPAIVGTDFGLRFKIKGKPKDKVINLVTVVTFPGDGLNDPTKDLPIKSSRQTSQYAIGNVFWMGYGFDCDWELVPGEWKFELWYEGEKYAETKFIVMKADSNKTTD